MFLTPIISSSLSSVSTSLIGASDANPQSGLVNSFTGALAASVTVLLTIFYGVLAARFDLLSQASAKDISKTCVKMFLPALLVTNVGSELHAGTVGRYVPILVWSVIYNALSIGLGVVLTRVFSLPDWTTPAIAFNNTTSLPLLLVQSLDTAGILGSLVIGGDTSAKAVSRAKSYFLINSVVGNTLTFALGPGLLNGHEEEAPEKGGEGKDGGEGEGQDGGDEEQGEPDEETRLLPERISRPIKRVERKTKRVYDRLPPFARSALVFAYQFFNAPLIGAVIGAIIGLTPVLHKAFFAEPDGEGQGGGAMSAWFTTSVRNVGELFATLQVIVVGVKLSRSVEGPGGFWRKEKGKMRELAHGSGTAGSTSASGQEGDSHNESEDDRASKVPLKPFLIVSLMRFVVFPAISIPLIWVIAGKTSWLNGDPILWFAMMLMPTGPPALKLSALADVNGVGEGEKKGIAKLLTLSYVISPLICFAVVGSLKASEAVIASRG